MSNQTRFLLRVSVVKVPILQHLESLRDEELEERREKRRRQLAEEEEAKQNERSTSAGEESKEQTLQVLMTSDLFRARSCPGHIHRTRFTPLPLSLTGYDDRKCKWSWRELCRYDDHAGFFCPDFFSSVHFTHRGCGDASCGMR